MTHLAEFINARLDEDEAALRDDDEDQGGRFSDMDEQTSRYVWRFADNDRVRREITAKRAIVNNYITCATADRYSTEPAPIDHFQDGLGWALGQLAAAWADHPDYKQEWAT